MTKPTLDLSRMARTMEDVLARRRGRVLGPTSSSDLLSSSEEEGRNAQDSEGGSPSSQVKRARVNKSRRGGMGEEEIQNAGEVRDSSSSKEEARAKKKDRKKKKVISKKVKKGPTDEELRERYERKKQYDRENAKR